MFHPSALLPHLCPQDLLLGIPLGACLEKVAPGLRPVSAPLALGSGSILRPAEVLPGVAVTCLQRVEI